VAMELLKKPFYFVLMINSGTCYYPTVPCISYRTPVNLSRVD
jgi:hypothetical protein